MAVWRCPECNAIIDTLHCNIPQWNSGHYYLPDPDRPNALARNGDYECEDTIDDDERAIRYECHECDHGINLEDLILDPHTNPPRNGNANAQQTPGDYFANAMSAFTRGNFDLHADTIPDHVPITVANGRLNNLEDNVGQQRLQPDYEDLVKCEACKRVILAGATDRINSVCPHCGTQLKTIPSCTTVPTAQSRSRN